MFILQLQDVRMCSPIYGDDNTTQNFCSLFYRGYLFIQVASYSIEQLPLALQQCRHFLETDNSVVTIILKTSDSLSLWSCSAYSSNTPADTNSEQSPVPDSSSFAQNLLYHEDGLYQEWDSQALHFWQEIAHTQFIPNSRVRPNFKESP